MLLGFSIMKAGAQAVPAAVEMCELSELSELSPGMATPVLLSGFARPTLTVRKSCAVSALWVGDALLPDQASRSLVPGLMVLTAKSFVSSKVLKLCS
jgi:hypothetical protein